MLGKSHGMHGIVMGSLSCSITTLEGVLQHALLISIYPHQQQSQWDWWKWHFSGISLRLTEWQCHSSSCTNKGGVFFQVPEILNKMWLMKPPFMGRVVIVGEVMEKWQGVFTWQAIIFLNQSAIHQSFSYFHYPVMIKVEKNAFMKLWIMMEFKG